MNDYTVKVACTTYYSASFEAETFDEAKKLAELSVSEEFDTCNLNQTTADAVFDLQKLRADENGKYVKSFRIHKC